MQEPANTKEKPLTTLEKATNYSTMEHIQNVQKYMASFIDKLMYRLLNHDKSKMENPELLYFVQFTSKLKELTYGSDEYEQSLKDMKPALDHHYAWNFHHPEHNKNGINGMTLVDLIEMLADWTSSVKRSPNGSIIKSLEINKKRFGISDQLYEILENTIRELQLDR